MAAPVNIVVGSHVWVEDPDLAWVDGEVSRIKGQDEVHVHTSTGKTASPGTQNGRNLDILCAFAKERIVGKLNHTRVVTAYGSSNK